jgi:hypothetical protein
MAEPRSVPELPQETRQAIEAAKAAVAAAMDEIKKSGGPGRSELRTDIGIANGTIYDGWGKAGNAHLAISHGQRFRRQIESWLANPPPDYRGLVNAHRTKLTAAVEAITAAIVSAGAPAEIASDTWSARPFKPIVEAVPAERPNHPVPRPTREDFAVAAVPSLLDGAIRQSLFDPAGDGVARLAAPASSGKTTAALVTAFALEEEGYRCCYLDFSDSEDRIDVRRAFGALMAAGGRRLIILDNVQRDAELASELLARRDLAARSARPLVVVIETLAAGPLDARQAGARTGAKRNLSVDVQPQHLGALARFYVRKFAGREIDPPESVTHEWLREFGPQLHAFAFALLDSCATLGVDDNWALHMTAAQSWVLERWLRPSGTSLWHEGYVENLLCLSVFGAQALELRVPRVLLPHPEEAFLQPAFMLGIAALTYQIGQAVNASVALVNPAGES